MARQFMEPWKPALFAAVFWIIHRSLSDAGADIGYVWMTKAIACFAAFLSVTSLLTAIRWWRLLAAIQKPIGLFGRVRRPDAGEAETFGLSFGNKDGNGIPLGSDGKKIIYWHGKSHASIRAPSEGGKTESSAIPICLALGKHRNVVGTAKGAELAIKIGPYRSSIGQQVIYIDPWRLMRPFGLPSHDFNPCGHLVPLAAQSDPALFDEARSVAVTVKPEPEKGMGDNKVFLLESWNYITDCLSYCAWFESDSGNLTCNLPYLHSRFSGSHEDVQGFFLEMQRCDAFDGAIAKAGARYLSRMEQSSKSSESFLTEVMEGLSIFAPQGALGQSMAYSDFDPADLKNPDKPTSVFIIVPPEKSLTHGVYAGLCLNTLINICIAADRFEPRVTIVADEFANLSPGKLPAILPTLFLGRSRGVQLITYVQDTESYARYGREASAFTTQSEVVLAWGIRSVKDAKEYSERAGTKSVVLENGSLPVANVPGMSLSLSEKSVPLLRPDEFMQLPTYSAALFYRQNPPLIIDLVSYRQVSPWRDLVQPMPGAPPAVDLPVKYKA